MCVGCRQNAGVESCFLDRRAECGQSRDSHMSAAGGQVLGSCAKSVLQVSSGHNEHCSAKLHEGELTFFLTDVSLSVHVYIVNRFLWYKFLIKTLTLFYT